MAKIVKCKSCGAEIEANAKTCPECGAIQKKMGCGLKLAIVFLSIVAVIGVILIAAMSGGDKKDATGVTSSNKTDASSQSETGDNLQDNKKEEKKVLYDGDTLKATFNQLIEYDSVEGCCYLQLEVENKYDKAVWVYLDNASVNGYSIRTLSSTPMYIEPGEKSLNPFIITYIQCNVEDIDEIESVKFEIVEAEMEGLNEFFRTDKIELSF